MMKSIKKMLYIALFVVVLLQTNLGGINTPQVSAQNNSVLTQTVNYPYIGGQCAVTQNILVYKGKSLSLIDKFHGDSQYLWIFDPVLTKVYYYDNGVLGGNPGFSRVSTAKFAGTTQRVVVMQSDTDVTTIGNKLDRTTLGGQFTYNLYRKYGFEGAGGTTHTEVKDGGGTNTKSVKFNPYLNIQNDYECQNIYVAFCGDGIVDNGSSNYYIGDPSTFGSQHLNGGEACDDGNTNDNDSCKNNCQINQPPEASCDSLTVTPIQGNAPLTVNYNCTATNATSYQINLIQNGNTTQIGTSPTGTYTITQPGYFQIQCVINGTKTGPQCTQSVTVNQSQNIDLEVEKRHSDGTQGNKVFAQGDAVGFNITVTNKGNTTATNFTVKDYLPSDLTFVSASNGGTLNGNTVTWNIPLLGPNQSITLYFTGTVNSPSCQAVNKAEACDYEESGEPQDQDSDPCNMGPNGNKSQDDESSVSFTCMPDEPDDYIDLEVEKRHSDGTQGNKVFAQGDAVGFNITVTNKGNTTATNFTVKDYLPSDLTFVSASNGGTLNGNTVTWNIPLLGPNQSITLYFTGTVNSPSCQAVNKAEACDYEESGEPQDQDSDPCNMGPNGNKSQDDESSVSFTCTPDEPDDYIDLELIKQFIDGTDTQKTFYFGDNIGFKITVTNKGNATANNFTVKDYFPSSALQFVSVSDGGINSPNGTITRNINSLAPGQSKTFYFTGKIISHDWSKNKAEVCDYRGVSDTTNPKDIDSDPCTMGPDGMPIEDDEDLVMWDVIDNPNNNPTCDSLTVTPIQGNAPLTVNYNCTATNATSYQINLIQNGNTTQIGTSPTGTYTITQPGYFQIQCVINGTKTGPQCTQSVNVGTGGGGTGSTGNYIDLELDKQFTDNTNNGKTFVSGDLAGFKIIVTNKGNITATDFTVKDYLLGDLQFVSASNGGTLNGNTVTWNIPLLAPNQSITLYFTGRVISSTCQGRNKAEICDYEESGEPQDQDSDPCTMGPNGMKVEDDEDIVDFACQGNPPNTGSDNFDLELIKQFVDGSNGPKTFALNDFIGFKITVLNKGPETSTNFTVKDYLPLGLDFVSASNGGTLNGNTITWALPPLTAGDQIILYLTGRLVQNIGGINKAEVCDYRGVSDTTNPKDIDSDPCNMDQYHEDDDDDLPYDVNTGDTQTGTKPVSCQSLTMMNNGNNNYTFNCIGNRASTYQINIYKDSISSNNLIYTIGSQYGNYTFANNGHYIAQCVVDGNISYKIDIYNNKNIDNLTCAYKKKPDSSLCAVKPTLAPYKVNYIPMSDYPSIPAPIEYCTTQEISTLTCSDHTLSNYGLVKDHNACKVDLDVTNIQSNNIDVGVVKSADKYLYTPNEYVTWTLRYTNHSNVAVSNISITDTMPAGLTYVDSSTTPTYRNGQTIIWDLGSSVTLSPGETRIITFRTTFDPVSNPNNIAYTKSYTNNVAISTPGDTNPNNNQSNATVSIQYTPYPFNYCGNHVVEIGEYCDEGPNGGTIRNGRYRGRICTSSCKLQDLTTSDAPKCADIDPPSINENEYLPYRWNIDLDKVSTTSACTTTNEGKINSNFTCYFTLYNGKNGTTAPIKTWSENCSVNKGFDSKLMSFWTTKFPSIPYGRSTLLIDKSITNGIYGEYKIELSKITYQICQNGNRVSSVSDDRLCQYNFVVAKPYLIQKGASTTTLENDSLKGYFGFGSNTKNRENLLKDVTRSLRLSSFNPTENISYLLSSFVEKYDKLAQGGGGVTYKKVSGKNIYIYENSQTLSDKDVVANSTIIIKNGDLRLEGTIVDKAMYIVPNGTITIGGDANCDYYNTVAKPQIINGILIAGKGFNSDYYLNNDLTKSRCSNGGLKVNGSMVGANIDYIINKRRTVLDGWFESASPAKKTQHIIDGSSLNITPNVNLWSTLPGADEVAQTLGVKKN